jgi:hypothetical protein
MRIRLIGQRNSLGIGTHYACFADALLNRPEIAPLIDEIDFTNRESIDHAIQTSSDNDINISFVGANIHNFFRGKNIQWTVFESDIVPATIIDCLVKSDQVWVPSTWGKDVLVKNGVDSALIKIVPEGVNADWFYPRPIKPVMRTKFLFVGKYEDRKSCVEIMEAWAQSLGNHPGAELIIKTNYFVEYPEKYQDIEQRVNQYNFNNLKVLWGYSTPEELLELYSTSQIFVFPSKGEGWGLPLIEAAAMGLPLITTNYSAQTDFLKDIADSCLFVDYDVGPITCPDFQKFYTPTNGTWGNWAHPKVDSLVQCLTQAFTDIEKLQKTAQNNSSIIRENWNWAKSADIALENMRNLAQF